MITWGICKHLGYQCVRFLRYCLSENTKPRGKVSRENYEPCPQSSHGWSLYYGQTGLRVTQLWNCCLQPELPFYVLLTLFPRLCPSVHSTRSCIRRSRPCSSSSSKIVVNLYLYTENHQLRWLTRVFLRLDSARYHCLPNVSINRAFTNGAINPKKKGNHFGAWKPLNHFDVSSNSFKLHSNMCVSPGPKKDDKKTP